MGDQKISSFKIAGAFVGTVIGAGFATGQEIMQFFVFYKEQGLIGLIVTMISFIIFGNIAMQLGKKLRSKSHIEIIKYINGKYIGTIMDYLIIFFLFGALTIMGAGAGAIVNQHFNISGMWGSMFMIVITALTVMSGLGGVINSISFLVPFLVTTVIAVSISSIVVNFNYASASLTSVLPNVLTQNWLWSAILYVSYNMLLSLAVLGPLGYTANDENTIRKGSIIGGLVLGAAGISIYFALLKNTDYIINKEVPMTYIAGQISAFVQIIYIIILIIAIYTTAVGSLYGFAARLEISKKINLKTLIIFTSILAFICTQFGFSNLIKYLYPLVGYGGIVFLVGMLIQPFRKYQL